MLNEIIANMTNLADSGQDKFVENWTGYAKFKLYEQGVSKKFLDSADASFVLGKAVVDLVEDGGFSKDLLDLLATLRVNHPHSEDIEQEEIIANAVYYINENGEMVALLVDGKAVTYAEILER